VDWRGNLSPEVTRRFVYRGLFKPLKLVTNGLGRTIGSITNGQLLEVGQIYKLKARQMPGWFFCGWGGSYSHHKPTIYFFMDEDVTLEANFCYAVSKVAKGSYQGTFAPLTNGPNPSSGWLSLNLSAGGAYSGRLAPLGANYQIRGRFDGFGRSTITGQRGADLLVLSMVILTNEQNRIFGSYTDGKFLSYFTLYPVQKFTRTGPPPVEQGNYTFVISPAGDASVLPAAHGSGTVTIDELGRVTISGELPDGVPIQQTAALLAGGRFAVLDNAGGGNWIVGSAIFSTNRSAFSGDLRWFNPDFPGGTNQSMKLLGSSFVPPPQEPIFDWMNGVVTLSGDALTSPLEVNVTANNDGTFTPAPNAHNLQISVDGSGLLSGSFIHPATQALTPLRGAVLQSSNTAFGLFEGATNGAVSIRAQ
jgi:hypothetical protein